MRLDVPPSPRLAALRADLLGADYAVCTQKASLLTDYLRRQAPGPSSRVVRSLDRLHARSYLSSLEAQLGGARPPAWKGRLNTRFMSAWARAEEPGETVTRFAEGLAWVLDQMELRLYPHELIAGNLSSHRIGAPLHPEYSGVLLGAELDRIDRRETNPLGLTDDQKKELRESILPYWYRRSVLALAPLYTGNEALFDQINEGQRFILTQFAGISHVTPDYPSVLRLGFEGIRARLKAAIAECGGRTARERQQRSFFEAGRTVAAAACRTGRRWQAHLRALAEAESDAARRSELVLLADVFEQVPARPARTFHEALQSIFITHVIVHQESFQHGVSFGRMDQYLHPYLERDLAEGRIDLERAVELIGCFLGKAAELIPLFFQRATEYFSGLSSASGITLGGRAADGSDAVNLVSHLFLVAYDQMRLRQPNLHVRVHPGSSPAFMARCYDVLKQGGGMPAFFNDDAIVGALEASGVAEAHAGDYAIVGCAEWGAPYRSFPAAGACFVSLPHVLESTLREGVTEALVDTEALLAAFRTRLRATLAVVTDGNNAIEFAHARHRPTPLLSILVGGSIERGKDVTAGGADYNPTGLQGVGLADVVDSLAAIERLVFTEGRLTLPELVAACERDFAADGPLHAAISNRIPRYGEDSPEIEALAARVSRIFIEEVGRFVNPRGGRYVAGFWGMTTHQGFGRRLGALPSGRKAGRPLANGASPYTGWDRRGPTASLSSAAAIATPPNGCVVNQKLDPALVSGEHGNRLLDGLLRGYFAKGGSQVQLNVLDSGLLLEARRCPEQHRGLVVRISGYSAYFNDLTNEMKDELIARSLHGACG
jgi:formate C-acetyltransferase